MYSGECRNRPFKSTINTSLKTFLVFEVFHRGLVQILPYSGIGNGAVSLIASSEKK